MLKPSGAQQADLNQLLLAQQDSTSSNYRQWLTPEQYADRFGAAPAIWRRSRRGWNRWAFPQLHRAAPQFRRVQRTAQQVANAFHTQIHRYPAKRSDETTPTRLILPFPPRWQDWYPEFAGSIISGSSAR